MSGDPGGPRGLDSPGWKSFWDLGTPSEAAAILFELHGDGASAEAADAAVAARADGREVDARFWDATLAALLRYRPHPPVWPH